MSEMTIRIFGVALLFLCIFSYADRHLSQFVLRRLSSSLQAGVMIDEYDTVRILRWHHTLHLYGWNHGEFYRIKIT